MCPPEFGLAVDEVVQSAQPQGFKIGKVAYFFFDAPFAIWLQRKRSRFQMGSYFFNACGRTAKAFNNRRQYPIVINHREFPVKPFCSLHYYGLPVCGGETKLSDKASV